MICHICRKEIEINNKIYFINSTYSKRIVCSCCFKEKKEQQEDPIMTRFEILDL